MSHPIRENSSVSRFLSLTRVPLPLSSIVPHRRFERLSGSPVWSSTTTTTTTTIANHDRNVDDDDDNDDEDEDEDGNNTDDDQHNNNNNGNNSSGAEDTCDSARYGSNNNNNNNRDRDRDRDDKDDKDDGDDEDKNKLNNRHHRQQQQQRGAAHRIDEVSPAKRNLLSSIPGGGAGGAGLIGVKLDLLTNLATNPSNGQLLINNNNNGRKIIQEGVEEKEEDVEIKDVEGGNRGEVIHGINEAAISVDAIAFLRGGRTGDPECLEHGEEQRTASTSYDIDQTGFVGGITPPILQNGVAGRPSGTYGDDPSVPSTSRRPDGHFAGTNTASNLTSSSPTAPSTAHQNLYRGVVDQFVSVPQVINYSVDGISYRSLLFTKLFFFFYLSESSINVCSKKE